MWEISILGNVIAHRPTTTIAMVPLTTRPMKLANVKLATSGPVTSILDSTDTAAVEQAVRPAL